MSELERQLRHARSRRFGQLVNRDPLRVPPRVPVWVADYLNGLPDQVLHGIQRMWQRERRGE